MKESTTAILFGYGSIGRRHARILADLASHLIIVDTKKSSRDQARIDFPSASAVADFTELARIISDWNSTMAVIATWGPSHEEIFHKLADQRCRRIFCEKPIANSIDAARRMVSRAETENISLAVNHYLRYSRIVEAIGRFAEMHQLGKPVSVVVDGGAQCLVTNGIHWIDFATELFGAGPERVISTAAGETINPRSPELLYFGGTAVWSFHEGREATISFSNRSSIALTARVYFPNAILEMDSGPNFVIIRRRDMRAVRDFPAVTRTGPGAETLLQGNLAGVLPFEECLTAGIMEVMQQEVKVCPAFCAANALSACIGALVSARDQRPVSFPIAGESQWARETWSIS